MKKIFVLVLFLIPAMVYSSACQEYHNINEKVVETAKKYLYVREYTNNNDHPWIDKILDYNRVPRGLPWCQASVNYWHYETFKNYNRNTPFPKLASCSAFAKWCLNQPLITKVYSTKTTSWGVNKIQKGDIASWKHGYVSSSDDKQSYQGHVGIVNYVDDKGVIHTIEGNTKPTNKGDQTGRETSLMYGHDGVYEKERTISLKSKFPILYFIRLQNQQITGE